MFLIQEHWVFSLSYSCSSSSSSFHFVYFLWICCACALMLIAYLLFRLLFFLSFPNKSVRFYIFSEHRHKKISYLKKIGCLWLKIKNTHKKVDLSGFSALLSQVTRFECVCRRFFNGLQKWSVLWRIPFFFDAVLRIVYRIWIFSARAYTQHGCGHEIINNFF